MQAKACLPLLALINFLSSYSNLDVTTVKFSHLTNCMGVCLKRKKVTSRLMVFFFNQVATRVNKP